MNHNIPITVTVPPHLLVRLDREAQEQRRSRSNMLSLLLSRVFEESPPTECRAPSSAEASRV